MANYPNVSGVKDPGDFEREILKPGSYIVSVDKIVSENKEGMPLLDKNRDTYELITFQVKDHPGASLAIRLHITNDGEVDTSYQYSEMELGMLKLLLIACGMTMESGNTERLIGKVCRAEVKVVEVNDKKYNNILSFTELNPGESFESSPEADANTPF